MKKNITIANLQFVLSIMVVLIHGQTVFINLPGKELQYIYGRNFTTFIEMFLSEGISRVAVPMFFLISGFFFWRTYDGTFQCWLSKLQRRIHTLVIPYLFWSTIVFFIFTIAVGVPVLKPMFTTRNTGELTFISIWDNVIMNSYNSPLWYLRYLIVFSIVGPLLYPFFKFMPWVILLVSMHGWFVGGGNVLLPVRWDATFCYCLGATFAMHWDKVGKYLKVIRNLPRGCMCLLLVSWLSLNIFHAAYLCQVPREILLDGDFNLLHHWLTIFGIFLGIPSMLAIIFISPCRKTWAFSHYSFLLFVCHHPLVNTVKKILMKCLGVNELTALLTYFGATVLTVYGICLFGVALSRLSPALYRFLSGNR